MGRAPCCDKANVKKGPWSPEEDSKLKDFIDKHGTGGNWIALPQKAGLRRCGKSCRLRWLNYLRPNIKHGEFTDDEDRIICTLFATIGSRWSIIAAQLPGRTDNDIKNYWNTKLKKKLLGISSAQRKPHHQQQEQQQQHFYPSCFETSAVASSTSPSSQGSCYTAPKPLFTNLEGYSISQDLLSPASCTAASPSLMQYHVKESGSLLMFGADQQSCSSSDGSCNQVSYAKEAADIEYNGGGEQLVFENYLYGGLQDNQKLLFSTMGRGGSGLWGDATTLEYTYEDFKQLLSPNPNTIPSLGANSRFVEGPSSESRASSSFKHQGRVMY